MTDPRSATLRDAVRSFRDRGYLVTTSPPDPDLLAALLRDIETAPTPAVARRHSTSRRR